MYSTLLLVCFFQVASAKPKEAYTPQDVCNSINHSSYKAQCETSAYRSSFDPKALSTCMTHKLHHYEKATCMGVIKNKDYSPEMIDECYKKDKCFKTKTCLKKDRIPLNKCLQISGKEIPQEKEATDGSPFIS